MHVRELLNDDEAVSPVIGVILMVAITVILAAVIATFVLGLGDQISSTAPTASFSFDYDESASTAQGDANRDLVDDSSPAAGDLTIRHSSGQTIEDTNLRITASPGGSVEGVDTTFGTEITAGSSTTVYVDSDAKVNVVWQNSDGSDSATLGQWTGPDA